MRGGFIGRDREQAELLAGLHDAMDGRGGVFLVSGAPGIGKTALAEHVAGLAADQGARVRWSRAWPGDGATPYWAWSQIIRSLLEELDEEAFARLPQSRLAYLGWLIPEAADRFGDATLSTRDLESDAGRVYLYEAVAGFLKHVSATRLLVLVLDDLLAGDRSSLLLLRHVARALRAARILVLATYRKVEATHPDVVEVLADLLRDGYLISLGDLEREETSRLIADIAGVTPWKGKVDAIHEATGGNPLFIREVTRLLMGRDPLDRPGRLRIPVPDSLRTAIRHRLVPLSAEAVRVLSAAAVVGCDFDLSLVTSASDLSSDRVLASLAEATTTGIVAETADTAGIYRFSHPLMREAIYEGLPLPARMRMHQRVGASIEQLHGADSPTHLGELAYHFSRAAGAEEGARAAEYARRAGDRAMETCAYDEAIVQYHRAHDAMTLAGPVAPPLRGEMLLRLGWAQARAGEYHDARPTFLLAAEIARETGDAVQLARAALGIGEQLIEGGMVDRQLVGLLEEAVAGIGEEAGVLRVRLLARLSLELTFGEETRREPPSLEAMRIARRLGDPKALADAIRARWMARWGPDGLPERSALADELLDIARESGDREKELIALAQRATCSLQSATGDAVDADVAAHSRLAEELRMPYHEWAAATMRAGRALLRGALHEAEKLAQDAVDRLPGRSNVLLAHLNQISALRLEQGRLGEMRDAWEALVARVPQLAIGRAWLGLTLCELREVEAAREQLRLLVGQLKDSPRDGLWLPAMALAALSVADLEDAEAAAAMYPLLLPYSEHAVVLPMLHPVLCLGSTSFYLGLLAATGPFRDEAEAYLNAAIQTNTRLGAKPLLARTHFAYARVLFRSGRAEDAVRAIDQLTQASDIASAFDLAQITERISALRKSAKNSARPVSASEDGAARDAPEQLLAGNGSYLFRLEGDFWTIEYEDALVRLPDSKGLRCLARLLDRPGEEILAVDLEAAGGRKPRPVEPASARTTAAADLEARSDLGDAGEMIDAKAKAAYRSRLEELLEEIEEAESFNDPVRAARAREEQEFLTRELARAVGLGGRDRKAASHAERARLNVTRAIRSAMKNVERLHPTLANHLALTIRTGRYCCYAPDPRVPIRWEM